jgi:hypothetical protein
MFYSDGTVKIERYTLRKTGFLDVKIRKIFGKWEMLAHKYSNGDERWTSLNYDEKNIIEHIEKYGVES